MLEQLRHALAFVHLDVEPVGLHHSAVVLLMGAAQVRRHREFGVRALHVVDQELREVAGDDPARMAGKGEIDDVAAGLLVRRIPRPCFGESF